MLSSSLRNSNLKIIQPKVPDKPGELGISVNVVIPMYKESITSLLLFPQNKYYKFWILVFANIVQNILFIFTNFK